MTKDRHIVKAPYDDPAFRRLRGPNGRRLCRWCAVEVPKGRQTWCSDPCVNEFLIRKDPNTARRLVFERDRGVCAGCELDTTKMTVVLDRLDQGIGRHEINVRHWHGGKVSVYGTRLRSTTLRIHWRRRYERITKALKARGFHDLGTRSPWDADHVKPVIEGGGGCGLDNYRTLCVPCHKRETAKLAARRAEARRPQIKLELHDG